MGTTLTRQTTLERLAVGTVAIHAIVAGIHGMAHFGAPVENTPEQWVFVITVITIMPLVGAALLLRGSRSGACASGRATVWCSRAAVRRAGWEARFARARCARCASGSGSPGTRSRSAASARARAARGASARGRPGPGAPNVAGGGASAARPCPAC